jgi:hypothetical protein
MADKRQRSSTKSKAAVKCGPILYNAVFPKGCTFEPLISSPLIEGGRASSKVAAYAMAEPSVNRFDSPPQSKFQPASPDAYRSFRLVPTPSDFPSYLLRQARLGLSTSCVARRSQIQAHRRSRSLSALLSYPCLSTDDGSVSPPPLNPLILPSNAMATSSRVYP